MTGFAMTLGRAAACGVLTLAAAACGVGSTSTRPVDVQPQPTAAIDRTVPPLPGAAPELQVPELQRHRLSNGLELVLVEHHELPVVDLAVLVERGAGADPEGKAGLAWLTADLLDEGTRTRSALELAEATAQLGAELSTSAGWDASRVALHVLRPRLEPALAILADVLLQPAFPLDEFERKKQQTLTSILQQKDEPAALASNAFAAIVYGPTHPYGQPILGTDRSVERITRKDVTEFYTTFYRPNNATLVVVGDVTATELLPLLERTLGGWKPSEVPALELPPAPSAGPTAIYLVDKPGAAQSEIRIGQVGVARDTPDYFPLLVANTILGGSFTSRLNTRLREERGYTYGARSRFEMREHAGPFMAQAGVFTAVTDSAIAVFMREIRDLRERPVPADELERARNYIALGLPLRFETTSDILGHVSDMVLYDLPGDYFDRYIARVQAVTADDVRRVAQRYMDPEHMAIVLAGDRAQIEASLRRLGLGQVEVVEAR